MEEAALVSALTWGGRDLQVSKGRASDAEIALLPGADKFKPAVDFYWFTIAGTYPKHVVPARFLGATEDAVGSPKSLRVLLPQIRQPFALRVEVQI